MNWQTLIAALLVALCISHALWAVLPKALRNRVALWLGKPLPAASGCGGGCDGCGDGKPKAAQQAAGVSVIHIVKRPPAA